jgi:hypothetical protein
MTKLNRVASVRLVNLINSQEITVRNLRVEFDISKTTKAGDNSGKVKIYNLSQASRTLAQARTKEGDPQTQVILNVGYQDEQEKLLFSGTGEVRNTFAGAEWLTTIEVNDGLDKIQGIPYEKKFPAGTSIQSVIQDLLGTASIPELIKGTITGQLPKARTFSGDPLKNIQDLQSTYGFKFDIQNGQAITTAEEVSVNNQYKTRLDPSTGLIGTPTVKGNLVVCEALLNPDLAPNSFVELASQNIDLTGNYIIEKATYKGDTWGGSNWTVSLEMKFISKFDSADNTGLILNPGAIA